MPQIVGKGDADRPDEGGRLVERLTRELRPHPTYRMLSAPTVAGRIRRIAQQPGPIREPLNTTTTGIILDGCARWQVALDRRQAMLPCLEYPLTDEAALMSVIRHHRGAAGLNDFCRILMSLELEPSFRRWGSQLEPATSSSNLTNVVRRDVRADLARIASASTGNITKVKQILETAIPEIRDALICGQLRIHRAWLWRTLEPKAQRDALWQHLNRRAMEQKIVRLVNAHAKVTDPVPPEDSKVASEVARRLGMPDASNLTVAVVEVPGKALVLTREFCEELRRNQVD